MLLLSPLLVGCPAPSEPPTVPAPSCPGIPGASALSIPPYLQAAEPTAVTILWETDRGTDAGLSFGTSFQLDQHTCAEQLQGFGTATQPLHRVRLTGLEPGTTYHYRVWTGSVRSEVFRFTTPPAEPTSFQLLALADSQRDDDHPDKLSEIVGQGVLPTVQERYGPELDGALAMVLFAGDLVDDGWNHADWVDFFDQSAPLFSQVPLYPVLGNREANSPLYFRYFELPLDEHVYTVDYGNVRVIGLDSNDLYQTSNQLQWLDGVLAATCDDPTIDFVFAQLHHPSESELWTGAETDWTDGVVDLLGRFSTDCAKPSIHFYGHTHGYARGAAKDHTHLMVDVASAGGRLDRWGRDSQEDRASIAVSEDQYGFVLVEVDVEEPAFEVLRFSRGTPEQPRDNVLTDRFRVRRHTHPPATPQVHWACEDPPRAVGSPFTDPDDDPHQSTEWELTDCAGTVLQTRWLQRSNRYRGVDLQAHDDLTDATFDQDEPLCVRARYRDASLGWSGWSPPAARGCP